MAALTISAGWKTLSNIYPNCSVPRWTWSKSPSARSVSKKKLTGTAPLPSEKPARRLEDIVENAQAALLYAAGINPQVGPALVPAASPLMGASTSACGKHTDVPAVSAARAQADSGVV